jgi:hypothetical protein
MDIIVNVILNVFFLFIGAYFNPFIANIHRFNNMLKVLRHKIESGFEMKYCVDMYTDHKYTDEKLRTFIDDIGSSFYNIKGAIDLHTSYLELVQRARELNKEIENLDLKYSWNKYFTIGCEDCLQDIKVPIASFGMEQGIEHFLKENEKDKQEEKNRVINLMKNYKTELDNFKNDFSLFKTSYGFRGCWYCIYNKGLLMYANWQSIEKLPLV